ncbi:MAG TPA: RNA-processing protein [Archaeoglobus profundus]|nr:RNA-processing protein [Archaeoglobus profundus]HIP58628.1 RNA-processing protein [Archaeoglobus profundus]
MEIEIVIPEDRIGVLIGKEGEVKEKIENATGCKLKINSKTGVVKIQCEDAINFLKAQNVIKAIAHGFNPDIAFKLLDEFTILDIIDISEFASSPNDLQRIKGRIIGKDGKMRRFIEDLMNVNISVYGKTVAIIGDAESVAVAREAIMMLIEGAQHSTVQRFLERKRREMKMRSLDWESAF